MAKVIILSRSFLAAHPRAGEPTDFGDQYLRGVKIHTLRCGDYYKDGEALSVRQWSGLPYRSKQIKLGEDIICAVQPVLLSLYTRMAHFCNESFFADVGFEELSKNDGLSLQDFEDWFFPGNRLRWDGQLIHFTDFRY